ncbi:MAG TPA: N-methyl-L-tryptophan oxidase [Candidatus Limnocylindrales bacterium]|nr:N-methyl-L-tryptophan oxidase [Candidatus Limnocylindrales bacterium]
MAESSTYDVVVVGAGVFGAWTAWHLSKRNLKVLVLDAYGAAHARASSGGETRIIRMSYAADEIYTRWSQRSLAQWKELSAVCSQPLFQQTGVLWLEGADDLRLRESQATIERCGIPHEVMDNAALAERYPQVNFDGISRGLLEPGSGILLARRAVQSVVEEAKKKNAEFVIAHAITPDGGGKITKLATSRCGTFSAAQFVFACGPWLGKVFPELLGQRIFPTRQEVFFFGSPAGDPRFASPHLPTWLFNNDEVYGMPDIESRGLKMARDTHGERVDPDTQSRIVSAEGAEWARNYVARRFPALKDAPIVETRVCQYENTSNGDFLIDRHPEIPNGWLAGGGSGHGFKHGPALGEYLAAQICGEGKAEPRFSLASKATQQKRAVF